MKKDRKKKEPKKKIYTSLILSHHQYHIHTSFFISLSKQNEKKNILKEVENRKKIFATLPLSLPLPPT